MGNSFSSSDDESADEGTDRDKRTSKKKTKKEKKEKKDKKKKDSDKGAYRAIRTFETQVAPNADAAARGGQGAADGSVHNGSVAGSILNSM